MRIPVAPDVTLAADAYGDPADPPVVLLHGGGQTRHSWAGSARSLGDAGWYALTVDLRGHGDSSWSPDGDYNFERFAEDVRALARSLPTPPALVGASLGGMASLLAVGECDEPVASGLVLVDIAPRVEMAGVARIRDVHAPGARRLPGPRGGRRRDRLLQPAPAAPEGPVGPAQEPPPEGRRPLVLALGPVVHGPAGARRARPRRHPGSADGASGTTRGRRPTADACRRCSCAAGRATC